MAYRNQSCFERCLDKFECAFAFLLQKTTAEMLVICMIWMIISLFVSWFGYKGKHTIHASLHSGFH